MKFSFLWRENYVGYLWASSVTASSYFNRRGALLYSQGTLSAYAGTDELKIVQSLSQGLADNPQAILKYEKLFDVLSKKSKILRADCSNQNVVHASSQKLYHYFIRLTDLLSEYINTYRWTEAHYTISLEEKFYTTIKKIGKNGLSNLQVSELLANPSKTFSVKHKISPELIEMAKSIKSIAQMRFKAKKIITPLAEISELLMREAAKRSNLAVSQISHLSLTELRKLLISKKQPNLIIINQRQKAFALSITYSKKQLKVTALPKKIAEDIQKAEKVRSGNKRLRGVVVYPGSVSGRARIVPQLYGTKEHNSYIQCLRKNDIIIAAMTSPDLSPAFSRVAGVITDEGGLMSHAALVARETKTPCIIGTKIATRFFKEGQRISIDGRTGTITK